MNTEQYLKLISTSTKKPEKHKKEWSVNSNLCIMFIEFRHMDVLEHNLNNICNIYGGSDVSLTIVYGDENKEIIHNTTKDWKNVRYLKLFKDSISVDKFSLLLCTETFWTNFSNFEHVLICSWDSYLFKKIPEKFFKYDLVGSPCGHFYIERNNRIINICSIECNCERCLNGNTLKIDDFICSNVKHWWMLNGGFSLRRVSSMISLCKSKPYRGEPEDVFYAISNLTRPTRFEAKQFGVQDYKHPDSAGCHKIWMFHDEKYVKEMIYKANSL